MIMLQIAWDTICFDNQTDLPTQSSECGWTWIHSLKKTWRSVLAKFSNRLMVYFDGLSLVCSLHQLIHRHHLCKQTDTQTGGGVIRVTSWQWDGEAASEGWGSGVASAVILGHTHTLTRVSRNSSAALKCDTLQCDISHFANWSDSVCERRLWCLMGQM